MTRPFRILLLAAFCVPLLAFGSVSSKDNGSGPGGDEQAQGYRNGRVLVKLRDAAAGDETARQVSDRRSGISGRREFSHLKGQQVLEFDSSRSVTEVIKELKATGLYEFVEPDRILHKLTTPNDPSFGTQWSLSNTGQSGGSPGADIQALSAWDTLHDAPNVIVAVIDTGARLTHSDLAANLWTNPTPSSSGYVNDLHGINSTVPATSAASGDPTDTTDGHGTHVSGIIGAVGNNSNGIAGIAWKVQLMELKFLGSNGGDVSDEIACINYAIAHGVSIINASYGDNVYSSAEFAAIQQARNAGIIFVAAAGNDGLNVDLGNNYPAAYNLDNIVAVAATTRTDALASYSDYGSGSVDLAAPGDEIYSTYIRSDTDFMVESGTSMAAPHVTGALALLKARFPGDNYRQLINRLLRSTTRLAGLSGKTQTGGRLNLAQALTSTDNRPFNDDFASRAVLSGANVQVRSSNAGATRESGEPQHASVTGGASLWWTWTAPTTGQVVFDTTGSGYDTVVAVYTGSSLAGLQLVGANDDASAGNTGGRVTISVTAGTAYQIAIDGKNGATGNTLLHIGTVPPNNDFANAQVVSGVSFAVSATNVGATAEAGEPKPSTLGGGHSVWYTWTAPATGHYNLAAYSNVADMIAGVYTGSSVSSLTLVAFNDDSISYDTDSLVSFNATAGQTYHFLIDDLSDGGDFTMSLDDSLWQYPSAGPATGAPAVGSDGTVYFASDDGYVYAMNPDGSLKWERSTPGFFDFVAPAIGGDGTVYAGGGDGFLYALNPGNGTRKWRFAAGTGISSSAAIAADGTIYFRDDNTLYALTSGATSATQKWTFAVPGGGTFASPTIATSGVIYVGAAGGALYAVNPDGSQKWKFTANGDVFTSAAIAADGTIYFGTYTTNGTLYALNPDGSLKWSWAVPGGGNITSSPALGADGTVYFGASDHKLHALGSNGAEKWSYTAGDQIQASSPAIAADGTIYFGDLDDYVYAVNASGTLVRVFATDEQVFSSPVVAGNRLYFTSDDFKLYAFSVGSDGAATAWPTFQQNARRTGLAVAASSLTTISSQPQSLNALPGASFTLTVTATGPGAVTYQWYKNGAAIAGATGASYTVASATTADAGTYTVVVTSSGGAVTSSAAVVTVGTNSASRLINLSARAQVGTGSNVLIVGFIMSGSGSKQVLLRGVGPTLGASPYNVAGVLNTPTLSLFDANSNPLPYSNTGWGGSSSLAALFNSLGAFALPANSADDALLVTLPVTAPGTSYTAQVSGVNSTTGVALAEIYDTESTSAPVRLANISARALVGTDANILIAGFIISGTSPKQVLIRATGPALAALGVPGTLADPRLDVYSGSTVVQSNDNWGDNGGATALSAAFSQVGAFPLSDPTSKDAALLITLAPGAYTAQVSGVNRGTGVALIELYEMP
ncbi:MAG TPA: PQQ-binding-like beta-propeller repeat protein [Opitutaceae bacterium]|nr:PQQ-binding-like beta-propeller repeat protein [Lacunisphaera sp.]HWA11400.1 PQQ-binding-like beta-propeller repeat protein [Opitutaceae bacterium]